MRATDFAVKTQPQNLYTVCPKLAYFHNWIADNNSLTGMHMSESEGINMGIGVDFRINVNMPETNNLS